MQLLTILTLIYIGILILALAVSLIAIWVHLRRVDGALEEAAHALQEIGNKSEPLEGYMQKLLETWGEAAEDIQQAEAGLTGANEHLEALERRSETVGMRR
jgi:uncharacterized protein YoxC